MLMWHTILYGLGQALPGLITFAALGLYTRLIDPAVYGEYSVALGACVVVSGALFGWLRSGLLRFASNRGRRRQLMLTTSACFLLGVGGVGAAVTVFTDLFVGTRFYGFPLFVLAACCTVYGLSQVLLTVVQSGLRATRHFWINLARAVSAVAVTVPLAFAGWQGAALMSGIIASHLLVAGLALSAHRQEFRQGRWSRIAAGRLLRFGWPISVAGILDSVGTYADRLILITLIDASAAGVYALSFEVARQSMWLALNAASMAGTPLVLHALVGSGRSEGRAQMTRYFTLLIALTLPAGCGLMAIAHNLSATVIGEQYREGAFILVPIVAAVYMVRGIRIFYTDFALEAAKRSDLLLPVYLVSTIANIVANLVLIPQYGIAGAGIAALLSNLAGLVVSAILARRVFPLGFPLAETAKIAVACAAMVAVLLPTRGHDGLAMLVAQVGLGAAAYGLVVLALDVNGVRRRLLPAALARLRRYTG
jgi:O-antigen/teichoic acid export membrane protein